MSNLLIFLTSFVVCVIYVFGIGLAQVAKKSDEDHERMFREWADGSRPKTAPTKG